MNHSFYMLPLLLAAGDLPPASEAKVDFIQDVKPILDASCIQCHAGDKRKGGFSINTRDSLMLGGETGRAVEPKESGKSRLIHLVAALDSDEVMPPKGDRLTPEQVGVLRAWIDQDLPWPDGFSYKEEKEAKLAPRRPELPEPVFKVENPIDRLLRPYFKKAGVNPPDPLSGKNDVSDRTFARRVYLDLNGLLPTLEELAEFEAEPHVRPVDKELLGQVGGYIPNKRHRLVHKLLADRAAYADHWLTFWNDMLRNGYAGTGFIDGGRTHLTGWLYKSLYDNKPYDQFVRELVSPVPGSEAFTKGIVWRGVVNASQRPEMQAAQSLSQVFFGLNLKCASCHDSPVGEWRLTDAYALAGVFADAPLDIHRCDKPIGTKSQAGFIFPQLGQIDAGVPKAERMKQLAALVTSPQNGRLSRTIVNRLWAQLMGRGLVEPVDEMDNKPWDEDLLDFLAADLQDHGYDIQRTLKLICTSHAYQMRSVGAEERREKDYVFRGPHVKRMSAEQYADALSALTGQWQKVEPVMLQRDGRGQGGQLGEVRQILGVAPATPADRVRAALAMGDPLTTALGRPSRDQVVTRRDSAATTLQALELTNGATLNTILKTGAEHWMKQGADVKAIYLTALGREPTAKELKIAGEIVGTPATVEGVQDLLWAITMQPDFQLIY